MIPTPSPDQMSGSSQAAELLLQVSSGDRDAFSTLYDAYASRVFGLVLRVVRDRGQAEEVTQEAFLEIWRTAGGFDAASGGALGWMLTIAHRRAVDRVRSPEVSGRRDARDRELGSGFEADVIAEASPGSLQAARVRTSLAVLTPVQRRALELAYFGGHTHTEVAHILQIPLGTSRTRIRNALIHLRESLGPAHA